MNFNLRRVGRYRLWLPRISTYCREVAGSNFPLASILILHEQFREPVSTETLRTRLYSESMRLDGKVAIVTGDAVYTCEELRFERDLSTL
jgi:hypothetical protein